MDSKKLSGQEGNFISSAEAARFTSRFHQKKKSQGHEHGSYVEAQFYGKEQLEKLLKKDGCVGLRFYRGMSEEKELNDQIIVVAVNADGKDLTQTRIGLKDMPADDGDALAKGPCCPHNCNP